MNLTVTVPFSSISALQFELLSVTALPITAHAAKPIFPSLASEVVEFHEGHI